MRTNGKCNNSHYPSTSLEVFCFPSEPNIPEGPEYAKYQHYINVQGEVLPTQCGTTTAVATSKESGKTDHSEKERTYNIRKQQTQFY